MKILGENITAFDAGPPAAVEGKDRSSKAI
jgi:hypothetical protein